MKNPFDEHKRGGDHCPATSHTSATDLCEEKFFKYPWTTAAVTFNPDLGVLAISLAYRYEDDSWGYPPHAQIPIASIDHLEGSFLAFVKGVPPDAIGMIYAACCAGDFFGAMGHLAMIYRDCDDSTRGTCASSQERARILHEALTFRNFSDSQTLPHG